MVITLSEDLNILRDTCYAISNYAISNYAMLFPNSMVIKTCNDNYAISKLWVDKYVEPLHFISQLLKGFI